jgi:hypothetical protein
LPNELPRETGETFDVPALPFGVKRIKGQRTLAGAADTRKANKFIPRENEIDRAQIVFAGTFDDDVGNGHTRQPIGETFIDTVIDLILSNLAVP